MSIEVRRVRGQCYRYERSWVNGQSIGRYLGPVDAMTAAALLDQADRDRAAREDARRQFRCLIEEAKQVLETGALFDRLADQVFRSLMFLCGYRLHGRSEWRQERGVGPMATKQEKARKLLDEFEQQKSKKQKSKTKPKVGLVRVVLPDPAKQEILDRAARGDRTALPAVLEMINDPVDRELIGEISRFAKQGLIQIVAGDDIGVAEGLRVKMDGYAEQLLQDAGPDPTFAERMLARRVAHAWVTVNALEIMIAQQGLNASGADARERLLSQAERRLRSSLHALAMLKRLRQPSVRVSVRDSNVLVGNPDPRQLPGSPVGESA